MIIIIVSLFVSQGEMLSVWYDHEERISNVLMSGDGMALGTSSWDGTVKVCKRL